MQILQRRRLRLRHSVLWPIIAAAGLHATGAAGQAPPQDSDATRSAEAAGYLQKAHPPGEPGVAALIARDDQVIFRGNFGAANTKTRAPIRSDTVFDIGSISKPFTAAAILLLMEEGKLALEDSLVKHLPEIRNYPSGVTLRHLLTHTSGLPHFEPDEERTGKQFLPEEVVAWHARQKRLRFSPGARYEYCNGGFVLLSVIVERITGTPFAEFVRQKIFQPLGMNRTSLRVPAAKIENRATGYRQSGENGFLIISDSDGLRVQGDGGIQSTAEDLLRWAQSWARGTLLRPDTIRAALAPATLNDGKRVPYGLGWALGRVEGQMMVAHDGRAKGFRAYLAMFPKPSGVLTVVVLANRREIEAGEIAMKLARLYLAQP